MTYIIFYVPLDHAEKVKNALFAVGAGKLGNYSHCSFESKGTGQFKPLDGSRPFIGKQDEVERVEELKVELICQESLLEKAIAALKSAHPYETPAYYVIKTLDI